MFLLVATALAGTVNLGWPCQRLNWGWRNVWSTCSVNSFAPAAAGEGPPNTINVGFRYLGTSATPDRAVQPHGVYSPNHNANIPTFFCTNAAATGSGATANLRNRCRRAVDAYGGLVRSCASSLGGNRGPVQGAANLGPDFSPYGGHQPHVSNVQALTVASAWCSLPPNTPANPNLLATPSNTCPGLLGWFTVVFNACGFTNQPAMNPTNQALSAQAPNTAAFFPLGGAVQPVVFAPTTGATGVFCTTGATGVNSWNPSGTSFRTTRCRKALDQFGRTAQRCHMSTASLTGPAQAGGYNDVLKIFAVGNVPLNAPLAPNGMNAWAPNCNV